ncbi:MAG: hypothetical protein KF745_02330 [Phycisphaeraceae bacterium]|nr:hypothetical protein [Phycisphaeraceae bacterium]
MTSVQNMLRCRRAPAAFAACVLAAAWVLAATACSEPQLVPPQVAVSPYDTTRGDVLWAVAPLMNESGTSSVDSLAVSDTVVNTVTATQGLAAVPMNRTLLAMRALGMNGVRSGSDARRLAQALGADGVIVGVITAWDPYNPPKVGMALALYAAPGRSVPARGFDPSSLQKAYSDQDPSLKQRNEDEPSAVVSDYLDGSNHGVQFDLKNYAEGRHNPQNSPMGWRTYLASMDLYTEFAAFWTVNRLLDEERLRLARTASTAMESSR